MSSIIGIDVAKDSFDIATLQANGKYRTKAKMPNKAAGFEDLRSWLDKHSNPQAWIVMEATGIYHEALAEYLCGLGYQVCVMNPAQISSYAKSQLQRVKTDKVDAKLIADYGLRHTDQLRAWQPEPAATKQLRALVRRLKDLQEIEQMESNRQKVADLHVQPSIQSMLEHTQKQIAETLKRIRDHIDDDPDLKNKRDLLVSIDGIGERTAAQLLGELGDLQRFDSAKAVTAFVGLNPRIQESGKYKGHTRISRMGQSRLRAALFMPGLVSMQKNAAVQALAERMRERGKAGMQIVCAAMRKLLHIAYGVLKSGQPYDAQKALAH